MAYFVLVMHHCNKWCPHYLLHHCCKKWCLHCLFVLLSFCFTIRVVINNDCLLLFGIVSCQSYCIITKTVFMLLVAFTILLQKIEFMTLITLVLQCCKRIVHILFWHCCYCHQKLLSFDCLYGTLTA